MTFYYVGYGYAFIEILKCFNHKSYIDGVSQVDLRSIPHYTDLTMFTVSAGIIVGNSVLLTIMHLIFKQDIKKYFARVMFKDD